MKKLHLLLLLSLTAFAQEQNADSLYMRQNYEKLEFNIPMRDGIKLFTIAYVPKDKSKTYPFLLNRTCYNASGYANYNTYGHPSIFWYRTSTSSCSRTCAGGICPKACSTT